VALGLTLKVGQTAGNARRATLAAAAFTFAVAIWSMHFVGMLALRLPMELDYRVLPTLLSLLISVFVVGAAVFVTTLATLRRWALALAAIIMGIGIATMHYIGMAALDGSVVMHHDPRYVLAAVVVAIGASALGLRFAFFPRPALSLGVAAIILGLAISGMHYVAMAGMTMEMPTRTIAAHVDQGAALPPDVLAVVVAVVAFAVSALFLLTLIPDARPGASPATSAATAPAVPTSLVPAPPELPLAKAATPQPTLSAAASLPIERNGTTEYLSVDQIVFIQADTHYTTIFDGQFRSFCPLSIGDVEQRLDASRFVRVHRSYLVALDRIASLQRAGDGGVASFDTPTPASVPVSRARYPTLKSHVRARPQFVHTGQTG
jgi:NO-binding membrane sensor protein with MHYT domain